MRRLWNLRPPARSGFDEAGTVTRKQRSYLLRGVSAEEQKLLAELPGEATLADEIAFLRLRIQHIASGSVAAEELAQEHLLARMLDLLTRMVKVQADLGEHDGEDLAELNELVRRRLVAAGYRANSEGVAS